MRSAWPLALCVLSLILAGCVDGSGPPAAETTPDDGVLLVDPETGDERLLRRVPVRFDERMPVWEETSFSGSFEVSQHGYPAGDAQRAAGLDPGNHHRYEITDLVPVGVPVRLTAEIDVPLEQGDLDIWFNVPGEAVWTADFDTPYGGFSRVVLVVLLHESAPIFANVWYDEYDTSASFDYELGVAVASAPQTMVGGIPVSVPVPSGASSIELSFVGDVPETIWFWGPDDVLIPTAPPADGRWNHTLEERGDHVLMLPEGPFQANVTLLVPHDGADSARPIDFKRLKQDIQQTDPVSFQANTPAETTFTVDRVPLQVGVQIELDRFSKDLQVTLEGPEAELMRVTATGDLPFYSTSPEGRMVFTFLTDIGVEGLAAGEYRATFSGDPNGPGAISGWVVHYARS